MRGWGILLAENKSLEMAHLSRRVLPLAYCGWPHFNIHISSSPATGDGITLSTDDMRGHVSTQSLILNEFQFCGRLCYYYSLY